MSDLSSYINIAANSITGNLSLPDGGVIYSEGFTPSGNPGNTIILQPAGAGAITNQQLLVYPTAGDGDHIHLTSGNLYQTELFLGSDNLFVKLANTGNIVINSDDNAGNTAQWKFGIDGNLTASGNLIIAGNANVFGTDSALIQPTVGKPLIAISSGANGAVSSVWVEDIGNVGTSNIAAVYANPTSGSGIVRIAVGQNGGNAGPNLWDFGADGNLTVPGNIIMAPNSSLIGSGASPAPSINGFSSISSITLSASGNITGGNISTTGQITSTKAGNLSDGGGQLYLNGSGNNRIDFNTNGTGAPSFTTRSAGAKVVLYPSIGASATDYAMGVDAGTLWSGIPAADGGQFFKWYGGTTEVANLSGTGMLTVTGNITGGNIITGGVVSATGNVSGNFFLGNGSQLTGITATSLVNGTSNVVTTNNGNVTIGIAGNAAIATFTGTGANVSGTLNVTGNVTAQGVGTNLVRRANTISGSNTAVTLDNLNAYVGGTPIRLYIGAATSNMTMAGQSQTMSTGALAVSSWINVPIVTGTGNGFAMSGAITNDGDTAVLNVTDQGAGSGTWRVTGMIANTSANLYSVSIERLA